MTQMELGFGGWRRVRGDEVGLPGFVYVRVQEVDGKLRATELYIDGRGVPLSASSLRRLPLAALAELADDPHGLTVPGPDLSRLAAHFTSWWHSGVTSSWVADSLGAQVKGSGVPQVPMPRERPAQAPVPEPRLDAPADGLTDEFLHDVARAYAAAVAHRRPPGKALAALAGVSDRTVHRWVLTARKRGIIPPAASRGRIV